MSQQQTEEGVVSSNVASSSSSNLITTDHTTNLSQQQNLSSTNGSDNMMIDTDSLITSSEKQLVKRLRQYETTAYSSVVSAFRAQGEISWEKLKVLTQLQQMLHISTSRHSTELLRSEVDVKIQQVAQSGVYNIIEREIEDKNNQFDFSLASETESENDNYVHHRVKHSVHSSNLEHIIQQSTTKESKRSSSTGRGRGRGKKRSSSTMVADSIAHSPSKATSTTDSVVIETPPNTPNKSSSTASASAGSQSQNGTPAKKKRGRKSKKQSETTPVTATQPTKPVVEPPVPSVQPVAAVAEPPVQQISEELRKQLALTTFLTDDDINRASMEEIESIADRESNEIEELEKKLADALDPNDTTAIVEAITKKKETLEKLIQKLETAEE